jgi:hypothetical protein
MEDCLRREAERVANQDILINKVVYDSIETDPSRHPSLEEVKE